MQNRILLSICVAGLTATMGLPVKAQSPLGPAKTDGSILLPTKGGFLQAKFVTQPEDGSAPVVQIGYMDRLDLKITNKLKDNPNQHVRGVDLFGIELRATPSGNTGTLFGSGTIGVGGQISLTYGRAFLASHVESLLETNIEATREQMGFWAEEIPRVNSLTNPTPQNPPLVVSLPSGDKSQPIELLPSLSTIEQRIATAVSDLSSKLASARTNNQPGDVIRNYESLLQTARDLQRRAATRRGELGGSPVPASPVPASPAPAAPRRQRPLFGPVIYDQLNFQLTFNRSENTLYDADKAFGDQFTKKKFDGFSGQATYQANYGGGVPKILGFALGYARTNNAGSLTSVEAKDVKSITSPDNTTERTITATRKGLSGNYKEESALTLKSDFVFYPDLLNASRDPANLRSSIALDVFTRTTFKHKTEFIVGAGIYLTKPGNPLAVYGGLNVYRDEGKSLAVDIVAGFPF